MSKDNERKFNENRFDQFIAAAKLAPETADLVREHIDGFSNLIDLVLNRKEEEQPTLSSLSSSHFQIYRQLLETAKESEKRFKELSDLAHHLSLASDVKTALNTALEKAKDLVGAESSAVYLLDSEKEILDLVASSEMDIYRSLINNTDVIFPVILTGETVFTADRQEFITDDSETYNQAVVPLKFEDTVVGCMIMGKTSPQVFSKEESQILRSFGDQMAASISRFDQVKRNTELESMYMEAQRMESIGQLAGGLAHDLNNILTVILCSLENYQLSQPNPNRINTDIFEATEAGKRAAELTNNLLAFCRKKVLNTSVLDLNDLVSGTVKLLVRLLGEDITLDLEELGSNISLVKVDKAQIETILLNLATNARHAMEKGGSFAIGTQNVHIYENNLPRCLKAKAGDFVMMSVSDTGIGIEKENFYKIFEPFYTTKKAGKGTGLGLSMAYGLMTQHGGFIDVESTVGTGTTFKLYFPMASKGSVLPAAPEFGETEKLRGNEHILLVEDDRSVLAVTRKTLTRYGYQVTTAENAGFAMLELQHANPPIDLILTDVIMPGMSGDDFIERIRPSYPGVDVLFMSGYTQENDFLEGKHFIQKPFLPKEIGAQVRLILDESISRKRSGEKK